MSDYDQLYTDPGRRLALAGILLAWIPIIGIVLSVFGRSRSIKHGFSGSLGFIGVIVNAIFLLVAAGLIIVAGPQKTVVDTSGKADSVIELDCKPVQIGNTALMTCMDETAVSKLLGEPTSCTDNDDGSKACIYGTNPKSTAIFLDKQLQSVVSGDNQ